MFNLFWTLSKGRALCWGFALADFGHDPCSSDSSRGSRNFVFFGLARFHRFPVGQILRHLNTITSIGEAVKTFGTEFWKFYRKGSFFQKSQKLLIIFPVFVTLGRHNSSTITGRWKFTTKLTFYGMSSFYFTVRINSKSFRTRTILTHIFGNVQCLILCIKTNTAQCCQCLATHMEEQQDDLETENK